MISGTTAIARGATIDIEFIVFRKWVMHQSFETSRNPWGKPGVFTSFSLNLGSPVVGEYTFFQGVAVQYGDWAGVWRGFNSRFATFFRGLGSSCESSHDAMLRKIKSSSTEPEKTEKLVFCQIFILLGLANNVIVSNRKNIQSNAIWGCKTITN